MEPSALTRILLPSSPESLLKVSRLCDEFEAVMLYGSVARGDAGRASDIDLLVVDQHPHPAFVDGRLSVTFYTEEHLRELARRGSLFVLHLRLEGRTLRDRDGALGGALAEWRSPDYPRMLEGIRAASAVLDVQPDERARQPEAFLRIALFVLRSLIYLKCASLGRPAFAMRRAAAILDDDRISLLFERSGSPLNSDAMWHLALELMDYHMSGRQQNPFGSLEALAVSWHRRFPMAAELAVRLLTGGETLEYALAPSDWVEP